MDRYNCTIEFFYGGPMATMKYHSNGDYVLWDDIEPLLAELEELRKFKEENLIA